MKLAYNIPWIASLGISRSAKRWLESGFVSPDQYQAIKSAHTTKLYTPNLFVRIALYIFTVICASGVVGLTGLIFGASGTAAFSTLMILLGIGMIVVLEVLIQQRHLFCAGIDDALLHFGTCLGIGGVLVMFFMDSTDWPAVLPTIIALPFLAAASVRYADTLTTAAAYCCMLFIICQPLTEMGPTAIAFLPLLVMAVSAATYLAAHFLAARSEYRPWENCIDVLLIGSLVTFYLGGNYFIVRQLTEILLQYQIPEGADIPLALLFYGLTVVVPIGYVVAGLIRRDSMLIRVGLLAAAFSVFTFRYYFHIIPAEIAFTFGGIILFAAAIAAIRYLRDPRFGITHKRLIAKRLENLDTEMLVVSNTLAPSASQPQENFQGGGGTFGGGGSTGNW